MFFKIVFQLGRRRGIIKRIFIVSNETLSVESAIGRRKLWKRYTFRKLIKD